MQAYSGVFGHVALSKVLTPLFGGSIEGMSEISQANGNGSPDLRGFRGTFCENEIWPHYLAQAYRSVVARPQVVLLEACRAAGTTVEAVKARNKRQRASASRQLVYALLRSSGLSWWSIAILVDRDHSTVIHGVQRVRARRQVVLRCALQRFRAGA